MCNMSEDLTSLESWSTISGSSSGADVTLNFDNYASDSEDGSSDEDCELYESFSESIAGDESFAECECDSTPFYAGSNLSSFQAMVLIFQFVLKHSLSNKVFTELLQLLLVLLPGSTQLPKSVYLFKKFFADVFPATSTQLHYCCSNCQKILSSSNDLCCNSNKPQQFVTVPLGPQLKHLFEGNQPFVRMQ